VSAAPWMSAAAPLGAFFDANLVNRRDVWGAYIATDRREAGKQSTYTAPSLPRRGTDTLEAWRVARHFAGESTGHVIGLHSTSPSDTSRWGAFDFDVHEDQSPEFVDRLLSAALDIAAKIVNAGGAPILEDSNGKGGLHLWIRFDAPVPTADCFAWLRRFADDAAAEWQVPIETYPKQASARGAFGNWLRLPGRHHTREHWSRVSVPGAPWYAGADAVAVLLAWQGTPAAVVPPAPVVEIPEHPMAVSDRSTLSEVPAEIRLQRYLGKLPHGNAGSGRSNRLYSLGRFLRNTLRLSDFEALSVLLAWNAGNHPPLSDAKVLETWRNTEKYNSRPQSHRMAA
jgi:hypothetical protein